MLTKEVQENRLFFLQILLSDEDGSADAPCHLSRVLPLQAAVRSGRAGAVAALLEAGADPGRCQQDHQQSPLLHLAVEQGHLEVAERLLSAGCPADERNGRGRPPMAIAAREDRVEAMQILIAR